MKKIVVFTGAGVSADSGISTFRDSNGLWANYRIEDVCTPEALRNNRAGVVEFYNMRRKEVLSKEPNDGHRAIVELSKHFDVEVITQNIDDLHERAAEQMNQPLKVLHLHGEIRKLRSSINEFATQPIEGWEQKLEDRHEDGSPLRPFVVFFGEGVPMMDRAIEIVRDADMLIIVGTSLAVYPAASLVEYFRGDGGIYLIDPATPESHIVRKGVKHIKRNSAQGLPQLIKELCINN